MFKDIFAHILQERNISAYKLSKDTGITQGMISYWKTGERTPSAESLNILADYLDCSVDYLLGRDEQQKKPTPKVGDGLTDDQRYLIDAIYNMSPSNVKKLRIIVDHVIAERFE